MGGRDTRALHTYSFHHPHHFLPCLPPAGDGPLPRSLLPLSSTQQGHDTIKPWQQPARCLTHDLPSYRASPAATTPDGWLAGWLADTDRSSPRRPVWHPSAATTPPSELKPTLSPSSSSSSRLLLSSGLLSSHFLLSSASSPPPPLLQSPPLLSSSLLLSSPPAPPPPPLSSTSLLASLLPAPLAHPRHAHPTRTSRGDHLEQ